VDTHDVIGCADAFEGLGTIYLQQCPRQERKKDEACRAENEVANFVAPSLVPILIKEIEGAVCVALGEELMKVCLKVRPAPDCVHCPGGRYRACHEDG